MIRYSGCALLSLLLAGPALGQSPGTQGTLLDRIVAIVNEGVVLQSELEEQMQVVAQRLLDEQTQLPPERVFMEQVLERLVTTHIQLQRAARMGIRIPDEELNRALTRVAARNGIEFSKLPAALASQGRDYAVYREDMRDEMIIDRLRQRDVLARIVITEREIDTTLARQERTLKDDLDYDISHVLLALASSATPGQIDEIQLLAEDIHTRLNNGEDFAEAALTYSDGQQALTGGRLGWRKGVQLPTMLAERIETMQPGDITPPLRNASGFHLFRLNDVRGAERVMVTQTRARHILIETNEILDDDAARQKLLGVRARVVAGESFEDVARVISEDPTSAANGGDLGWQNPGTYLPQFEAVCDSLEPGQLSEPFRTPFGWHLVQLEERREHDSTEDIKRNKAIRDIQESKRQQELELWLRQLRDEAYVEYRL